MTEADRAPFTEMLAAVYALYRVELSRAVIAIWWQALQRYDLAAVQEALGLHSMNPDSGQYLPKPADAVRMLEGSTTDSAITAWTKVERAIAAVGVYASVVFDDPLIHRVIADMGGWPHLGTRSIAEWPFVGKEFCTRYRALKITRSMPQYPPKLAGLLDQENLPKGYAPQPPVLIGNHARARAVLEQGSTLPMLEVSP